jgi:hypothetical protein
MALTHGAGSFLVALGAALCATSAFAQSEGGLYIAGYEFSFQQAAERAMAQNPGGQRFFVLAVPPQTSALTATAEAPLVALRDKVLAANGVLLVCQRDLDSGKIAAGTLAPRVVAVRGFPPPGSTALPPGERYFQGENPADLPASNEALRRLRSTCSN